MVRTSMLQREVGVVETHKWHRYCAVLLLAASVLLPSLVGAQASDGDVLAKIGDDVITEAEFSAEMARRGRGMRGQFTTLDQRQALLDEMVRERLMVNEAKRLGLDQSPAVIAALRKVLITQVTRERLHPILEQVAVTPEEVRASFDADRAQYRTPERIRGAIIEFRKPTNATPEVYGEFLATIEAVHRDAQELPAEAKGFGALAQDFSDDRATRYVGGMLPWLYRGQGYKWGSEVVGALFALDAPGSVGPIVETETSMFLVRLAERDVSRQLKFEQYAPGIRNQLLAAKRAVLRDAFYRSLEEAIGVELNVGSLATLAAPPVTEESPRTLPTSPTGDSGQ